ncbi:MAG TPA: protein kinase [Blastocatellia bacterium]|nr:protein kinase [Blastocatellia bacterium]
MTLASGTEIEHYRILARIGAGGMGEVYLAEDTRLGRKAALKLLPSEYTRDPDRLRRFEQEARAASALNHPNILTIYEIGETNSGHFIATEFIEGKTLRRHMSGFRMPLREALDVAIQVGGALSAAHQAGIIHRDIKPENVMLRPDGYVKVVDFGIAKLSEVSTESRMADAPDASAILSVTTEPGIVMGSPNYMSPEQARGFKVDARTDIFSLGAVLYEMIAGRKAFDGPTVSDILVSLLERDLPPLSKHAPDIPPKLELVVRKALAKNREERCQTIDEMLSVLRRIKQRLDFEAGLDESISPDVIDSSAGMAGAGRDSSETVKVVYDSDEMRAARPTVITEPAITRHLTGRFIRSHKTALLAAALLLLIISAIAFYAYRGGPPPQKVGSLAVLPFANVSTDPNSEYLSDGITESLINNLSQAPALKVMSRNSVFRYKGQGADPMKVGQELNVEAVLLGRIEQRGEALAISIELVNARDNSVIWGEQYNRRMPDLITVQEEIARRVSEKLSLRLTGDQRQRISRRYTDNSEAYHLYLRGRYQWNKRTEEGMRKGIEFFNEAIAKDPRYALAHAGLADCYALLIEYGSQPPTELRPMAEKSALRALEIDDTLAEAHNSLAAVYEYDWNWAEAEKQYRRAIELNPNYATAHQWYAIFLSGRGRANEAIHYMKQALELDPLSLIINTSLGRIYYCARDYGGAVEQLHKTLEMEPNFAEARFHLGLSYEAQGRYDEAISELDTSIKLFQDRTYIGWLGRTYAVAGRRDEALKVLGELKEIAKRQYVPPYMMAIIHTGLGDKEQAFEWLNKVYEERSYFVIWLNVDPIFDPLRGDPRFQDLLRRVGLPPVVSGQ